MDKVFCRYCSDFMPASPKEIVCKTCNRSSIPLSESHISISVQDVKEKMDKKQNIIILDVRWPDEVRAASIKGSMHIPLNQLEKRMGELPKDKEIIVHCHHGSRSRFATILLLCNKFSTVKNMVGGINEWSRHIDPLVPRY